jgi:ABC-type lipoprotein release transport system permease subunit
MSMLLLFSLSCKYLLRYRRRYLFLALALGIGFCIVTVIVTQKDGMVESVYQTAQSHYAGDIVFEGIDKNSGRKSHMDFGTASAVVKAVDDSGISYTRIVKRTILTSYEKLYYNGASLDLKYTVGIDGDNERDYLASLKWRDGVYDEPGPDTIYISAPIAARLGAVRGDSLILEVLTCYDQKNTGTLIIGGIIEDSSLFGFYKIYVSRKTLNNLVRFEEEDATHVGVFLSQKNRVEGAREAVYDRLKTMVNVSDLPHDRDSWATEKEESWDGIRIFPLTVEVYLSEVSQILQALNLLTYFLYVVMLLIILVSAIVTYRLILHERIRELGTMRAIGFKGRSIRIILVLETLMLATVSIIAGIIVSLLVNSALSCLSFDWIPSFEIFMRNGRLAARYAPASLALNAFAVYSMLIMAVWFPAFAASRQSLPDMLSTGLKG